MLLLGGLNKRIRPVDPVWRVEQQVERDSILPVDGEDAAGDEGVKESGGDSEEAVGDASATFGRGDEGFDQVQAAVTEHGLDK